VSFISLFFFTDHEFMTQAGLIIFDVFIMDILEEKFWESRMMAAWMICLRAREERMDDTCVPENISYFLAFVLSAQCSVLATFCSLSASLQYVV